MQISRPMLLPKAGYVEIMDANGNHVYKATAEMQQSLRKGAELWYEQILVLDLAAEHEERICMLEIYADIG